VHPCLVLEVPTALWAILSGELTIEKGRVGLRGGDLGRVGWLSELHTLRLSKSTMVETRVQLARLQIGSVCGCPFPFGAQLFPLSGVEVRSGWQRITGGNLFVRNGRPGFNGSIDRNSGVDGL